MKISIFTWIYNRAHLLKYNFESLQRQIDDSIEVEVHVADSNSTDGLDDLLLQCSKNYGWAITRYQTRHFKQHFNNAFNCPAV